MSVIHLRKWFVEDAGNISNNTVAPDLSIARQQISELWYRTHLVGLYGGAFQPLILDIEPSMVEIVINKSER